jgi:UDPglucose 6-dehydrogenase
MNDGAHQAEAHYEASHAGAIHIAVVGLGYVGLTTAVGLAASGHRVTGIDIDAARVAMLERGRVPMHEPGLEAALGIHGARMTLTTSLDDALATRPDVVMIAVQTPGESGTRFVEDAARDIGRRLRARATIVMRSTTPLGTTLLAGELASREYGEPLPVASNPEFLVEGRAFEAFMQPDRIVVGVGDEATAELMRRLYAPIEAPLVITDIVTAELAKYAANAYLATQVSFINEMADLAEAAGADVAAVSSIIKMDRRVGERAYLNPGIGYGGSCLPKDLRALTRTADDLGVEMRLARAVNDVNEARAERVVEKLRSAVGPIDGRRVAVWGLAFKGGTNDVRESPAIDVVRHLVAAGADVRAYDPLAEAAAAPLVGETVLCDALYEPLEDAEALLILTDCKEFAAPDYALMAERMRQRLIIDGRNMLPPDAPRAAGFAYIGIGRVGGEPALDEAAAGKDG